MPGPRSSLPSLDDAIAFAKGVARVLSQMTGNPYGEPALSELRAGEEKSEEGFGNPVAFAHTVIDWYVQATGDFLYGTGEVSRESYNLALSSAAVARSACEYAGIGWWLAEPGISINGTVRHVHERGDQQREPLRQLLGADACVADEAEQLASGHC